MKHVHKDSGRFYDKLAEKMDDDYQMKYVIYRDQDTNIYCRDKVMFEKKFRPVSCKDCKFYLELKDSDKFICTVNANQRLAKLYIDDQSCKNFQLYKSEPEDKSKRDSQRYKKEQ